MIDFRTGAVAISETRQMQRIIQGKRCQPSMTGGCRSSAPLNGAQPAISSQPANMRIHADSGSYEVRIVRFCVCIHNGEHAGVVCAHHRNPYLIRYRQTTVRGRLFLISHTTSLPSLQNVFQQFPEQPSP